MVPTVRADLSAISRVKRAVFAPRLQPEHRAGLAAQVGQQVVGGQLQPGHDVPLLHGVVQLRCEQAQLSQDIGRSGQAVSGLSAGCQQA